MSYTNLLLNFKGNLGADADTRHTKGGKIVTSCSIAHNVQWTDKQTGQVKKRTEWTRLVIWNRGNYRLAEIAAGLAKGMCISGHGEPVTRKWIDSQGNERYITECIVEDFHLVDTETLRLGEAHDTTEYSSMPAGDYGNFDDDIPF